MCRPLRLSDAACRWRGWVEAGSVIVVTERPEPVAFFIVKAWQRSRSRPDRSVVRYGVLGGARSVRAGTRRGCERKCR